MFRSGEAADLSERLAHLFGGVCVVGELASTGVAGSTVLRRGGWFDPGLDPFLCRITALMGSLVAGAGVNPADQRWGFWPLLPIRFQSQVQV